MTQSIQLNVGGVIYETTLDTLRAYPNSPLARQFSSEWRSRKDAMQNIKDSPLFLDADGAVFGYILNFLRRGKNAALPVDIEKRAALRTEADYFGLDGLVAYIDERSNIFGRLVSPGDTFEIDNSMHRVHYFVDRPGVRQGFKYYMFRHCLSHLPYHCQHNADSSNEDYNLSKAPNCHSCGINLAKYVIKVGAKESDVKLAMKQTIFSSVHNPRQGMQDDSDSLSTVGKWRCQILTSNQVCADVVAIPVSANGMLFAPSVLGHVELRLLCGRKAKQ